MRYVNRFRAGASPCKLLGATSLAVTLFLGACGGSAGSAKSADQGGTAPEEFGLTLAQLSGRVEETEKLIARCMATKGFSYVALDFAAIKNAMSSDQSAAGLSDEAYLKQYGFGISTQFDKPIVTFGAGPQNNALIAGLPALDQVAYRRALWGEAPDWNHSHALEAEDFAPTGGCTRTAAANSYSPDELNGAYVNPADKRIDQDQRVIAAYKKWSDCIRTKGFQYENPDQIDADLRGRLAAIVVGQDPKTLTGSALTALKQLQGDELAIAAVAARCGADLVDPVRSKVEEELFGSKTR